MNIYLLIVINVIIIILGAVGVRCNPKRQKWILAIQCICVGTLYGLRDMSVGHDSFHYFIMYEDAECFKTTYTVEPAFQVLVSILRLISPNVNVFIWLLSMITAGSLAGGCFNFMDRKSEYTNLVFALLYLMPYTVLMQVNVVRQGIACSIMFLGISILHRKKYLLGIIVATFGCLFHYAAFVILAAFLFFFFVKNWKIQGGTTFVFMLLGLLIANTELLSMVLKYIPENPLTERLISYIGETVSGNLSIKFVYYIAYFIFALVIFALEKSKKSERIFEMICGILSASLLISFNPLAAGRLVIVLDYFIPVLLLGIPNVEERYGVAWKKRYTLAVSSFCIVLFVVSLFTYSMRVNLNY